MPGQLGRHLLGRRGGDDREPDAGQLRGRADEPDGRRHQERRDEGGDDHELEATLLAVNVVFVEPAFPPTQRHFVRALAEVGATVIGVGERPAEWLDDELRSWMPHYHQVSTVVDAGVLTDTVRARPGLPVGGPARGDDRGAHAGRRAGAGELHDPRHVRAHGVAVPRQAVDEGRAARRRRPHRGVGRGRRRAAEVHAFADAVGFPIVLKPRTGAGALDTTRVDDPAQLEQALGRFGGQGVESIAVEEFVEGHEGFYDTLSGRRARRRSTSSRTTTRTCSRRCARGGSPRSSSPRTGSTRRPDYQELRDLGARVNAALGIGTSATHMEWFFGPKGLRFSEIGCRPPGVGAWDLYSAGNDVDLYREWANAVVHGHVAARPSRRFATGIVALRPDRDGHISGYSGVDEAQARLGEWVIDAHLPPPGTPTQPVEAGYWANAYVRMRHPDYDVLRGMLDDVGRTVHVYAG